MGGLYYKPLFDSYYTIVYFLFKANSFVFHFLQVIFFITNASILFLIFKKFFKLKLAFVLSLLFLIHPINSEVALYIADTQDVLFLFFGLLAILILTQYQSQKSTLTASLFLLLSLFSKETGILFFISALLYAFFFKRKHVYSLLTYSFILVGTYALLRIHAVGILSQSIISASIEKLNLANRLVNTPSIFLFYLRTFFFPLTVAGAWQWVYMHIDLVHFFIPLLIDLFFVGIMIILGILVIRKNYKLMKLYLFFSIWFLIGIVFHLQIFPLDQTAAERWFYFPIVGVLGMLGVLFEIFQINFKNKWILAVLITIFVGFSIRTFIRSLDWVDDFTIAMHDSKVSDSYNAEYIISHSYYMNGQLQLAKIHAEKSIQLFPYITNYTNLGVIDSRMGNYKDAKIAYLNALKYGNDVLPYENLAALSLVYGDPKQNIEFIKNVSLRKYPKDGLLWFYLTILEYKYGNKEEVKKELAQAKRYYLNNSNINFIEYIITNNKMLGLKINNGQATFYTK